MYRKVGPIVLPIPRRVDGFTIRRHVSHLRVGVGVGIPGRVTGRNLRDCFGRHCKGISCLSA